MFLFVDSLPVPSVSQLSSAGAVRPTGKFNRYRVDVLIAKFDCIQQDHLLGVRDDLPQPLQPLRKVK